MNPLAAREPVRRTRRPMPLALLVLLVLSAMFGLGMVGEFYFRWVHYDENPSHSMKPTLKEGQFVLVVPAWGRLKDGDVVEFVPPIIAVTPRDVDASGKVSVHFIKRVVGVPGDLVEIKKGVLYRNGIAQVEPFTKEKSEVDFELVKYKGALWPLAIDGDSVNGDERTAAPFRISEDKEMETVRDLRAEKLPPGYCLVMGDSRNESFDSRF